MVTSIGKKYDFYIQEVSSDDELFVDKTSPTSVSLIAPSKTITEKVCAVSLLFVKTFSDGNEGFFRTLCKAQHGLLFFETINAEGMVERYVADFDPHHRELRGLFHGRGFAHLVKDEEIIKTKKIFPARKIEDIHGVIHPTHETWLVNADKVNQVFAKIHFEQINADLSFDIHGKTIDPTNFTNYQNLTPYGFFGQRSIFSRKQDFYLTGHRELWEFKEQNPEEFKRLCWLVKQKREIEKLYQGEGSLWKEFLSTSFSSQYPISFSYPLLVSVVLGAAAFNPWAGLGLYALLDYKKVEETLEIGDIRKEIEEKREILQKIEDHTQKMTTPSHNCISWAVEKLKELGIDLEPRWLEYLATTAGMRSSTQYSNDEDLMTPWDTSYLDDSQDDVHDHDGVTPIILKEEALF